MLSTLLNIYATQNVDTTRTLATQYSKFFSYKHLVGRHFAVFIFYSVCIVSTVCSCVVAVNARRAAAAAPAAAAGVYHASHLIPTCSRPICHPVPPSACVSNSFNTIQYRFISQDTPLPPPSIAFSSPPATLPSPM